MSRISHSLFRLAAAFAVVSWTAVPALAQPTGAVTFAFPLQTTTDAAGAAETAGIVSGAGSIEHWFAQDRGRIFYYGSLDRFRTTEAFDTWLHNAGGVRTFDVGQNSINTGAALFWRHNSGGWADAGFRGFNVQSTFDRTFSRGTLSAAYNLYHRNFTDAPELTQLEHLGHVRALTNLPTRTTLVGTVAAGRKRYDGAAVATLETPAALDLARGRGRGTVLHLVPVTVDAATSEPSVRTLWTWNARIAQSLDDRTGVWLEREERRASGDAPPALVWTPPLFYDDGVYDDPYVIEARTWRAGARRAFARGDELTVWIDRSGRNYDGLYVVNDAGTPPTLRSDTLLRSGIDASIVLRSLPAVDVILLSGYSYVQNVSNDQAESYRSHIGSIGLSFRF